MFATEPSIELTQDCLGLAAYAARGGLQSLQVPPAPLTEAALCDWIAHAQAGESIQYHEGLLLLDRSERASHLSAEERARIHATARRAWVACERGLVHLFSIRVLDGHFRYLAIRSGSVLKPQDIQARRRPSTSSPNPLPQ